MLVSCPLGSDCVNNSLNLALADIGWDVLVIITADFFHQTNMETMIFKIRGCPLGCPDSIANIGKTLSQLQGFFLAVVCNSKDDITKVWQMEIGSLKSLVECFFASAAATGPTAPGGVPSPASSSPGTSTPRSTTPP